MLVVRIYQSAVTFAAEDHILSFGLKFEHLSGYIDTADLCINRSAVYLFGNRLCNEGCAHRRYDHAFSFILPVLCQIHEHKGEFLVFLDIFAFVVDEDRPVGIAVVSYTEFGAGGDHEFGERFQSFSRGLGESSGESSVAVSVDGVDFAAEFCEYYGGCQACRSASRVGGYDVFFVGLGKLRHYAVDVFIDSFVSGAFRAYVLPVADRVGFGEEDFFELYRRCIVHLGSVGIDDFNAVILGRVVRCRDHGAAVVILLYYILQCGGGENAQIDNVAAGGKNACFYRVDKRRSRCSRVHADRQLSFAYCAQ